MKRYTHLFPYLHARNPTADPCQVNLLNEHCCVTNDGPASRAMAFSHTILTSLSDFHLAMCARPAAPRHSSGHSPAHLGQAFTTRRPRCQSLHRAQAVVESANSTDAPTIEEDVATQASEGAPSAVLENARADSSDADSPGALPPALMRPIWDSIGKPLMRVGKAGVQKPHINSFKELLHAHTLFKVQINQHEDAAVKQTCQQLSEQGNAKLLQIKGRTALFTASNSDLKAIQEKVSAQPVKTPKQKATQQQLDRVWHNADSPDEPISLQPDVKAQLQFLKSSGVLGNDEPDDKCLRTLSRTPPAAALTLLRSMNKTSMRQIRNKSAWLNSQCGKLTTQAKRESKSLSQTSSNTVKQA